MESTERHVRTWIASGREDDITELVEGTIIVTQFERVLIPRTLDISVGRATLLDVVKALGEYLTSEEDVIRSKGVDLLSRVIERCPPERINRQATRVLVSFYSGKLEDPETVIPALKGLVSLTSLPTYSDPDAVESVKALFARIDTKSLNQSTRYLVFKILDTLVAGHRSALQGMGDEFLSGYMSLVDGEKDPRNLLLAFSIDRVICIEFDISRHIEAMFNIIFCYFPITFKPPADDPYGITSDDLKTALRSCMSASPLFGELAVTLFLDKLLGGSPAAKKDIIETISLCAPVYGAAVARKNSKKLWNFLKMEVFQPVNPETEGEALKATQALIQTIYSDSDEEASAGEPQGIITEISKECLELMNEPEKSQAVPASKVMASFIGTTPKISKFALSHVIPHLMKLFQDPEELVHRSQILTLLCIIVGAIEAKRSVLEEYGLQGQLLEFKDDILGAFISGTKNPSSCEAALEGIKKVSIMPDVLSDEELVYVVHNINELLQSDAEDADVASDDALAVLATIADRNSKVVEEYTLPLLFSSLPDSPPLRDAHRERAKCWRTLHLLARLCVSAPLFETLVVRLTTKLDIVCASKSDDPDEMQDPEPRAAYAHGILKTLGSVIELKVNANHADVPKYIDRLVPRLYNLLIYLSLADKSASSSDLYSKLLEISGQIITLVVRTVPPDRQKKLALDLYSAYFDGNVASLCSLHQLFPVDYSVFRPFKSESTSEKNTVVLLSAAFVAFHRDVLLPHLELNEALGNLQDWVLNNSVNDLQRHAVNHMVASLLNKNSDKLSPFISRQLEHVYQAEISSSYIPIERRRHAIESWLWIGKALILLNSPSLVNLIDSLFSVFGDRDVGWDAARTVGEIASGGDDVLTKSNHATIRILYAQKYFKTILPKIFKDLQDSDQPQQQKANLVALSTLISALPKTVYANELPTLMPFLIRGLDLPDSEIRTSIINTFTAVASSGAHGPTQEHASTLVSIVLKNALTQEASSTSLRMAALKYLAILPRAVRYDVFHPLKAAVIRELGTALDDPKRAVRKEAVDARAAWFSYKG
ncbi:hypothetical protein ACEPAF_686 [Sanghuangporus sanghuang]